jgi:hypothetical protein
LRTAHRHLILILLCSALAAVAATVGAFAPQVRLESTQPARIAAGAVAPAPAVPRGTLFALVQGSDFGPSADPATGRMHPLLVAGDVEGYFRQEVDPFIDQELSLCLMWPFGYWTETDPQAVAIGANSFGPVKPGNVLNANHLREDLGEVGRIILERYPDAIAARVHRVKAYGGRIVVYIGADSASKPKTQERAIRSILPFILAGVTEYGVDSIAATRYSDNTPGKVLCHTLSGWDWLVWIEPQMLKGQAQYDGWHKTVSGHRPYGHWSDYTRARWAEYDQPRWWIPRLDAPDVPYGVSFGSIWPHLDKRASFYPLHDAEPWDFVTSRLYEANYWLSQGRDVFAGLHGIDPALVKAVREGTWRPSRPQPAAAATESR